MHDGSAKRHKYIILSRLAKPSIGYSPISHKFILPDWLCKPFSERYQYAPNPSTAPRHHKHLSSFSSQLGKKKKKLQKFWSKIQYISFSLLVYICSYVHLQFRKNITNNTPPFCFNLQHLTIIEIPNYF